ncbi:YadA C-terminal domain-containing protein [uncultured Phascolarctobacterium sp.]|uniref:YadA C-terminal domain-containing protein n=1 Tax=uncultured Phascolarctobacterium sp. TaxID=512296 RepID=UPI0025F03C2E|nr:YadA C-terminal domain-containing protein [uncultured Phascolarctobacterium sp.]
MKKMLVKAVALSLVLGGVGFVANDAFAANIGPSVNAYGGTAGFVDVLGYEDGKKINAEVEQNKTDIRANSDAIKTKADAWETTKNFSKVQEQLDAQDNKNKAQDVSIKAHTAAIKANKEAIKTKADALETTKNFSKVQEQLDAQDNKNKAQDASIKANGAAIKANSKAIDANAAAIKANKAEADEQHKYLNSRVEHNSDSIQANANAIANETQARKDADNQLRADLNQETIERVDADNRLQTAINQKADKTTVAENTAAIESNKAAIAQEKKIREHADQKLQDQITINKGQIENEAINRANEDARIEAKFDGEVARLDSKIDKLDTRVEKVGAMAAAIANLHTMGYDPEAPTEIAVGVGQYRDKTGMALGAFHYPNRDFMLSFSVSTAGDEFMGGIGATWKFGRKSPEELRQAEAEKAAKAKLAKAEAAKKAAKDARVAAQQKRHAEMLAARTGK